MSKKITKQVTCLKCKKVFTTEVDTLGVPYKRICKNCKRTNTRLCKGIHMSHSGINTAC